MKFFSFKSKLSEIKITTNDKSWICNLESTFKQIKASRQKKKKITFVAAAAAERTELSTTSEIEK